MGRRLIAIAADGSQIRPFIELSAQDPEYGALGGEYIPFADASSNAGRVVFNTCFYTTALPPPKVPNYFQSEIATADFDGSNPRRLTENTFEDIFPSWSPDGKRIAFLSVDDWPYPIIGTSLVTMSPEGEDWQVLAAPSEAGIAPYPPAWSPDGERLLFMRLEDGPAKPVLYVVRSDGSGETRVSDARSVGAWSPDSRKIAFAKAHGTGTGLFTINPDGSDLRFLVTILNDHRWRHVISWSPDGAHILFSCESENVCVVALDTLTVSPVSSSDEVSAAAWSPDGSRVAVRLASPSSSRPDIGLYTVRPDGTDIRWLAVGWHLRGVIPPLIGDLDRLVSLKLHYNWIGGIISAELGDLDRLEELNLHYTYLTGSIPAELGKCWQPAKVGHFETQEIRGRIEV